VAEVRHSLSQSFSKDRNWRSAAIDVAHSALEAVAPYECPITYEEMMMGHVPITPVVFGSIMLLLLGAENAFAQHAKGIVLCEAACSKFDKACQGRCLPRGLRAEVKACIETCRQRAAEPDLIPEMTRCVSACLSPPTQ
jgi:hypothetical protein